MLKKRLGMIVVFLVFAILAWMNWNVVDRVRVNGPVYKKMVMGKDLLADSLPPPCYLLQAYHCVLQITLLSPNETKEQARLLDAYIKAKSDFIARHKYWSEQLHEAPLKDLEDAQFKSGMQLLDNIDQVFLPLTKSADKGKMLECLNLTITPKYSKHLEAVNEMVAATISYNQQVDTEAGQAVEYCKIILASYMLLTLSSIAAWRFYRIIAKYIE